MVLEKDLDAVLEEITKQVKALNPGIVVVDSFRTVVRKAHERRERSGDAIVHPAPRPVSDQLGGHDVSDRRICPRRRCATIRVHRRRWPLLALAGAERNSVVRKLQIMKLRGQASVPGLHTIRISDDGLQAFSRTLGLSRHKDETGAGGGGFPSAFPSWTRCWAGAFSKATASWWPGLRGRANRRLATQFIAEGLRQGEPGIMAIFEERPEGYTERAGSFGLEFESAAEKGKTRNPLPSSARPLGG